MKTNNRRVVYYTDCLVYGGCEKSMFEVMASQAFVSRYDYLLVYRMTKEYTKGMRINHPDFPADKLLGINLFDINTVNIYLWEMVKNRYALKILKKLITEIFILLSPFIFIYDYIILYFIFLRNKPEIVHINNGGYPASLSCRAAAVAAKNAGARNVIMSVNNIAFKDTGYIDRVIDSLVRRSVDAITTASAAAGRALAVNRGFNPKKIITLPHGIEGALRNPDSNLAAGNMKVQNDRIVSIAARFEERKGHKYAIEAFKEMLQENKGLSGVKLILMGEGPMSGEIKELVSREGLDKNIIFMGQRDDCIDYIAKSLFLLLPSIGYEDLPFVILEAMSLGVPVIGTDVAGIPEEIENGITGIVVPPKDAEAIKTAMVSLISDDNLRIKMGKASRERFDKLFTLDRMISRYLALYESIGESPKSYA